MPEHVHNLFGEDFVQLRQGAAGGVLKVGSVDFFLGKIPGKNDFPEMIDHIGHGIAEIERVISDVGEAFLIVHAVDDGVDYPGKLLSVFADPHVVSLAGLVRSIDYLFHNLIPQLVLKVEKKLRKTLQVLHSSIFSCHVP